ncbi:MAG TPA: hypothetical protein VGF88_20450 [Acidobacteriaceae bacterium]|jgi:ribosome modulation factor
MHLKRVVLPVLALMVAAAGPRVARASGAAPVAPGQISFQVQWDAPPQELNEIQRRGFHDGIEGARRDFENHRPPNVENREEYRHPQLPPEQREVYRDGFRRGYARAMQHLGGGPGMQPPPPPRGDWNTVPNEFDEMHQRGFRDGIEGARRDFDNHRRPDVENRDEYRHPHVPYEMREAYREGFRRGYARAMAHLSGRQWEY